MADGVFVEVVYYNYIWCGVWGGVDRVVRVDMVEGSGSGDSDCGVGDSVSVNSGDTVCYGDRWISGVDWQ